ncbi:hypothetical protein LCGC14_1505600 [marine sediment metagenome]|uniref:Uncharacterized protein n=1 Tax=marine sediment metagenome TaxID=412755 RepID=A0A0F9LI59_9ZZZZ
MSNCEGRKYWDCKGDYRNVFEPKFRGLGKDRCNQCGKLIPANVKGKVIRVDVKIP